MGPVLVCICLYLAGGICLDQQTLNTVFERKSRKKFATQPVHLWLFYIVPSTIINQ